MSYNLMAEGDLDFFELSRLSAQYRPLELFPVPAANPWPKPEGNHQAKLEPDALGIAIPSSCAGAEAAAALRSLVEFMWSRGVKVFDLYSGEQISTPQELGEVAERIAG
jgi:hypothetical protein